MDKIPFSPVDLQLPEDGSKDLELPESDSKDWSEPEVIPTPEVKPTAQQFFTKPE